MQVATNISQSHGGCSEVVGVNPKGSGMSLQPRFFQEVGESFVIGSTDAQWALVLVYAQVLTLVDQFAAVHT